MVAVHNYTWHQGEDLTLSMVYKQGPTGSETAVNLTGYSLRMDIVGSDGARRYTFNSDDIADPLVDEVGPEDNEATLGADGSINILVPRSLTLPDGEIYDDIVQSGQTAPTFQYDVFLRDNGVPARQKKILKGQITVEKSVTLWP